MADKSSDDEKDAEDVRFLFSGDTKMRTRGIERLYLRHRQTLLRKLIWKRLPIEKAEDVLQQTFVNVLKQALQPAATVPTYVGPWLWAIAYNILRDAAQIDGKFVPGEELIERRAAPPSAAPDAVHPLAYQECLHAALQDLERTEPLRAEALRLCHLDGWSIEKAAVFVGRSPGATRTFLYASRPKLRPYAERCWELLLRLREAEVETSSAPREPSDTDSSGGHADE